MLAKLTAMLVRLKQFLWRSNPQEPNDLSSRAPWPKPLCGDAIERQKAARVLEAKREREEAMGKRNRSLSVDIRGAKTKTKDQMQSSLFSTLPAEIRLQIYEMVLCETGQVHIIAGGGNEPSRFYGRTCLALGRMCPPGSRCYVHSNLLLTCRRIYREAIGVLYSGNGFIFQSSNDLLAFTRFIVPHRLNKIKFISVGDNTYDGKPRFERFKPEDFLLVKPQSAKFFRLTGPNPH